KKIKTDSKTEQKKSLDKKLEEGRNKVIKAVGEEKKFTANKTGAIKISEPRPEPAAADIIRMVDKKWEDQYIKSTDFDVPYRVVQVNASEEEKEIGIPYHNKIYFQITEEDLEREDKFYDNETVELKLDVEELKALDGDKIKDMWKDYDPERPGYVPAMEEIQNIRNAVLSECLQKAGKTMEDFNKTQKNGEETGATYKFLKEIGAWEMYKRADITKRYHQYNVHKLNNVLSMSQKRQRADVNSNSSINLNEYSYETQGAQNCFCCSLSAIYNHFVSTDPVLKNDKNIPKLNQEKVRSFEPRYLGSKEVTASQFQEEWMKKDYVAQGRSQVEYFAGVGKQTAGNTMDVSDVLFESKENGGMERKDVALVEKNYYLSRLNGKDDATQIIKNNVIIDIKKQIHKGIDSGQMVSIVAHGHYVTIISLKGNECRYLESSSSTPTIPKVKNIDDVLKGGSKDYSNVGISFLRKITDEDKERLKNEYRGFGIDEETGEVIKKNEIVNETDIAHRTGIVITKDTNEIIDQGDADIANYVSENICISKAAFMSADQKKKFDKKNDQGWKEAKAEWEEVRKQQREENKIALRERNEQKRREQEAKEAKKAADALEKEKKLEFNNIFEQKEKKEFVNAKAKLIESEYNLAKKKKITPEEKEGYLKSIRLIKSFNNKMKDKELNDLTKKLIHFDPKGNSADDIAAVNAIERLFLNILNFDVKDLEAEDYDGMVEKMNKYSELFDFASGEAGPLFEAYKSRSVNGYETAVNTLGVEMVEKRLGLIRQYKNFYYASLLLKKDHEKTHTEMILSGKSVDDLSVEEISAELSKKGLKPEQLNYYSLGLSVKTEGTVLNEMKNEKANKRQMEHLLENLNKGVTAYDDQISLGLRVKDCETAYTKHKNITNRRLIRLVSSENEKYNEKTGNASILASKFNGDDDGVAAKIYGALKKGTPKINASKEEKQRFIDAVEVMATAVMSFDSSKFIAENGAEFYRTNDRYADCKDIMDLSDYLLPLLAKYEEISKDGQLKAVLDENMLKNIEMRAQIYSAGKDILGQYADNKTKNETDAYYMTEEETRDTERIKEALAQKRGEERTLAADKALAELTANSKSYINSGSFLGVSQMTLYNLADEHKLRDGISQNLREKKMKNRRSELYKKAGAAEAIVEASKVFRGNMAKRRREISFSVSSLIKEEEFKALSAYFGEDKMDNTDMVRQLKQNKNAVMDRITRQLLAVKLDNIDMSTDEKLVESTGQLEEITQKLSGYKSLIEGDEAYKERLRGIADGDGTLLDKVQRQMRELSAVTEYYRVRKLLITNPYYMSHYHDEISPVYKNTDSKEQKEASRLVLLSIECARRMKAVFGDRAQGADIAHKDFLAATEGQANMSEVRAAINDQAELGDGMEGYISSLEEKYRTRSYATGRIDTSLCTKENLNALVKEFIDIKKKGGISIMDHKSATKAYTDIMKKASPAVSQILRYWMLNSSNGAMLKFAKEKYPQLTGEMETLRDFEKGRGNDYSTTAAFNNKFSGTEYELGVNLNRILDSFSRMSESEGMSDDEAMEIFEGFNIANWKDYDPNDEQQVKEAEDRYLRSLAKYFKMEYEHHMRFLNTYGLIPDQMPIPLLAICLPDSFSEIRLRIDSANIDDLISKGGVKNGVSQKGVLEVLAEKGYIEADMVEAFKKMANHLSGTGFQFASEVIDMGNIIINNDDDEDDEEDVKLDKKQNAFEMKIDGYADNLDIINSHRGDYEGWDIPRLSEEEEKKGWKLVRGETAISKNSYKERESSYLKTIKKENERVKSLNALNRYVTALIGVDTDGHSDKYIAMNSKLSVLVNALSNLSQVPAENGKNVSKNEILMLRRMYGELIEASKSYLKGKNREHKNELYRRRYDIVDDMLKVLDKDYAVLNDQMLDRRYSLNDVLTSSRSETISIGSDKIEKYHGAMSTRNMFTMEINGEQKKLAFTKTENLRSIVQTENRYKEFKKDTDKYKTFPQLAWIAENMNRDYLDAFFRKPAVKKCIEYIEGTKGQGEDIKETRERLENEFRD
ncbi:MAG: hypothetical protein J6N76_10335, partial [Lachnospiraceae bacterium]|nr:hypothetical protein [Lachnospiraceae bacterium]